MCPAYEEEVKRVLFTEEMRQTHTILLPTMLPRHFKIISAIFHHFGYNTEILDDGLNGDSRQVIEAGLANVHNDTCYPALLIIGQMLTALKSGRYDTHKVALLLPQTGGGCRASNYIFLARKALKKAGFEYVPIISLNFSGLEDNPGFKITLPMLRPAMYGILYGDLLMWLVNQCKPYEVEPGSTEKLADEWSDRIVKQLEAKRISYRAVRQNYAQIVKDFAALPKTGEKKVRVGIVGEIFVKFSPLGNNDLEKFLIDEGAETVMAGLLDFILYCIVNPMIDFKLYGFSRKTAAVYRLVYRYALKKQRDMAKAVRENSDFHVPGDFEKTRKLIQGIIGEGVKMGEGWLLTAEMMELIESGAENVVITQPFGCLPNHIVGKGMMKPVKERYPHANLVAIDYDSGATKINQENRLKLMLANARLKQ
ncbi:MAG: 2-hydroxyacyl-CoA dehydratase [Clostridia bacterium]|nr:2-hydroxyacyl-CoA dehydratase [Clostridia bacterium]